MRYTTAAILSVMLIGGMFGLSFAIRAVAAPYIEQGLVIPRHVRIFLEVAFFLSRFRYVLALPIAGALFLFATFTGESQVRE